MGIEYEKYTYLIGSKINVLNILVWNFIVIQYEG